MNYIDYSEARLSFIGTRKHIFKDKQYHINVFDDFLLMGIVNTKFMDYRFLTHRIQSTL